MNAKEFLDYIFESKSKNTAKNYRNALKKFSLWYKGEFSVEALNEVLEERKKSLKGKTAKERRKFERLIEKWHRYQIDNGRSVNTARSRYVAIVQFFKFFDLDLRVSIIPSEVKRSVISERDYPLTIEELRQMFAVADLRGRTVLLMAKDLGLRLSDFRMIRVEQLPNLDSRPPVPFNLETRKEHVWTKGFLSAETAKVLKTYLAALKKRKRPSPYLWPSNGRHPLDEDSFGVWLKKLAEKAGIKTGNQRLTFHCFRRLLMRAAIETGVGLTAAKLMTGKAVAKSDATYIAKAKLKDAFIKLSKYLNVTGIEAPSKAELEKTVVKQQREIGDLKDSLNDLSKRLDLMTREVDRLRVRYQHQYRLIPTGQQLTDEEADKILESEKKTLRKLKKEGYVE